MATRVRLPSIDQAAWLLIRKYGDCSAVEAFRRSQCCRQMGDEAAAAEWRLVMKKVVELHFQQRSGGLN